MYLTKVNFWLFLIVAFILGWIGGFTVAQWTNSRQEVIIEKEIINKGSATTKAVSSQLPEYVTETLEYVREYGQAPEGYVGGRQFQNREKQLPELNDQGKIIQYREWDVHPKVSGKNRGAERLVTSEEGKAYFTQDHYRTFIEIN